MALAATAALYAFSLAVLKAPCWSLFPVAAAVAWPIWRTQREYALFERRAILAGITLEESRIRRWFWAGKLSSAAQVFVAMFWAILLLAFASRLGPWQWSVLAADAVFLALLIGPVTRWLGSEVHASQSGLAARRWPLAWINIAVLALAFFVIDFHVVGAPDTRGLSWEEVATKTYLAVGAGSACSAAGGLAGVLAALDALAWHAAEILIPSLPNQGLKWFAWALFLLQAGVIAFALTRLHLGLAAAIDRQGARPGAPADSSRAFLLTIAAIALMGFLLAWLARNFDASTLGKGARQAVAFANPCRTGPDALAALKASLDARLLKASEQEKKLAGGRTAAALDALFAQAEKNIDGYLDWYFSIIGEYQRIAAMLTGSFAEKMREELEQHVFGEGFKAQLEQASRDIEIESLGRISKAAMDLSAQVKAGMQSKPCLLSSINLPALGGIERDALRASTAAFGGAGVMVAAGVLASRAARAATAKATSKRVFQGATTLGGRVVTKRGGSILVAAAGGAAVCGLFAPLCALAAGAVAWISLDKAFIRIDEIRFRDEMRKELLESLHEQKSGLGREMIALHEAAIDRAVSGVQQSVQRAFVPARDGV